MTCSDLIAAMVLRFPHFSRADVETSVRIILDGMSRTICQQSRVEIRGFGIFTLNHRPPRIGRNPRAGEKVDIPATDAPHFKSSKKLQHRVNIQAVLKK